MQRFVPVFGLFAILFIGMISPSIAQDYEWDEKYRQLEADFENKRLHLEQYYQEEYQQLEEQYAQHKMEIYDKVENNPELSDSEIDAMFQDLISDYEQKRRTLESSMMQDFEELERMFQHELQELDKQRNQYYEEYDYDSTQPHMDDPEWQSIEPLAQQIMDTIPMEKIQHLWETGQIDELINLIVSETNLSYEDAKRVVMFFEKYDTRNADGTYDDYNYDGTVTQYEEYSDYKEPYEYDPEWQNIEPLAQQIMTTIPMEKIQSLWESGQFDELINLIVSETNLNYDEAKRVVMFFEKYDTRNADGTYQYDDNFDYSEEHQELYPSPPAVATTYDEHKVQQLEERITELEQENQMLRETIMQLEEKITQINAVLMEQVKFIYEWVQSQ
ncbi:MAG: hypothetical protein R3327_06305 [Nitrosopumilaceae archaeon]|nr:hypothetical protein [Nitrosopumilaceae archaeon]